jgi:hypothetical protein
VNVETLRQAKELILEGASVATLLMACAAVLLIEFWGIKKIWKIVMKSHARNHKNPPTATALPGAPP